MRMENLSVSELELELNRHEEAIIRRQDAAEHTAQMRSICELGTTHGTQRREQGVIGTQNVIVERLNTFPGPPNYESSTYSSAINCYTH